jgi:hypothetical protein
MAKYVLDDADVFDLFHTLRDFRMLQMRMERVLKHITGLPNEDDKRHEDTSYAELVKNLYKEYFGCTPKRIDDPTLKVIPFPGGKAL